jgi:hypothetical protein
VSSRTVYSSSRPSALHAAEVTRASRSPAPVLAGRQVFDPQRVILVPHLVDARTPGASRRPTPRTPEVEERLAAGQRLRGRAPPAARPRRRVRRPPQIHRQVAVAARCGSSTATPAAHRRRLVIDIRPPRSPSPAPASARIRPHHPAAYAVLRRQVLAAPPGPRRPPATTHIRRAALPVQRHHHLVDLPRRRRRRTRQPARRRQQHEQSQRERSTRHRPTLPAPRRRCKARPRFVERRLDRRGVPPRAGPGLARSIASSLDSRDVLPPLPRAARLHDQARARGARPRRLRWRGAEGDGLGDRARRQRQRRKRGRDHHHRSHHGRRGQRIRGRLHERRLRCRHGL